MSLSKEKLDQLRETLRQRRATLVLKLAGATASHIENTETFNDPADQASATSDRDCELALENQAHAEIRRIDDALRRITAGTFGECVECGESISEPRMLVHPETILCIDCKAELESEKNRFPGRG